MPASLSLYKEARGEEDSQTPKLAKLSTVLLSSNKAPICLIFSSQTFEMASSSNPNSMQTEPTQNAELGKAMETPSERPEWLPEGWKMEVRTRDTGKTKGMKDRVIQSL